MLTLTIRSLLPPNRGLHANQCSQRRCKYTCSSRCGARRHCRSPSSRLTRASTPLLPEQQGDPDQLLQVDSAIALAQGCNSAVDALLCWIEFSAHDTTLSSTKGKRITTNCASLWAYVLDTRPDLVGEFIAAEWGVGWARGLIAWAAAARGTSLMLTSCGDCGVTGY